MKILKTFLPLFTISIFLISCSSSNVKKRLSVDTYLIMESDMTSPEVISRLGYFYPSNGVVNKKNFLIKNINYNFVELYISRDGFHFLPCCEFGEVSSLAEDVAKSLKIFNEKDFDSLSKMNGYFSAKINKDINEIRNYKKTIYTKHNIIYRVMLVRNLEYCSCVYTNSNTDLKYINNKDEGFLLSLGKTENVSSKISNEIINRYLSR